jgi:hypothetical protein
MYIQVWLSENINDTHESELLSVMGGHYSKLGNVVGGRRLRRFICTKAEFETLLQRLNMYGKNIEVIGVQNPDGSDYDEIKYPKNVELYQQFMQPVNSFNNGLHTTSPAPVTGAGWVNFNE